MAETPSAYPVFLDLRNRLAVVTQTPTPALIESESDGLLTIERRAYERGDLAGAFLVFCLDPSEDVRRAVFAEAEERACLVSMPGAPESSSFSSPSVMRRGALQIAISTAGIAPAVAKRVREMLQDEFGEEWAAYVTLLGELRRLAPERAAGDPAEAARIVDAAVASDLLDRIRDGHAPTAEELLEELAPANNEGGD